LDEEYFVRKNEGNYETLIQPNEYFTCALPVPEESDKQ
jgi:hypothetical protein